MSKKEWRDLPDVIRKYPRPRDYLVPRCRDTITEGGGVLRCQRARGHQEDEHSFLILWHYNDDSTNDKGRDDVSIPEEHISPETKP